MRHWAFGELNNMSATLFWYHLSRAKRLVQHNAPVRCPKVFHIAQDQPLSLTSANWFRLALGLSGEQQQPQPIGVQISHSPPQSNLLNLARSDDLQHNALMLLSSHILSTLVSTSLDPHCHAQCGSWHLSRIENLSHKPCDFRIRNTSIVCLS